MLNCPAFEPYESLIEEITMVEYYGSVGLKAMVFKHYDSMPVVPPNDEYVSEDELQPSCTDSDSGSDSRS
ncbi:hypothetical protein F2Q70_00015777 [Brassica cretica]|uniref:Uncharacterized protein n=1 Tax=Brassica cretica TaxID=69181 RepID=A0A8S9HRM1_BRACR|nr:hypothetical protein F2Q70_00015777 [Brassica cretica]